MRKKLAIALTAGVAAATVGLGAAGTVNAAPQGAGKPVGVSCMQYGHSVLRSFGSPAKASQDILGLPLNQVLALHRNAPSTAAGILIGLGLPESDVVAACGQPA
jgi:hypothetical protein